MASLLERAVGPDAALRIIERMWDHRALCFHGELARHPIALDTLTLRTLLDRHNQGLSVDSVHGPAQLGADARGAANILIETVGSVRFEHLEKWWGELKDWMTPMYEEMGLPRDSVQCNAFVSRCGSGLPPHFHRVAALVFMVSGEREFWTAPNATHNPLEQLDPLHSADGFSRSMLDPTRFAQFEGVHAPLEPPAASEGVTTVLKPGSCLFIPPGLWHGTRTLTERSLSISAFLTFPTVLDAVLDQLRWVLTCDPNWRRAAPLARQDTILCFADEIAERLTELCHRAEALDSTHIAQELLPIEERSTTLHTRFRRQPNGELRIEKSDEGNEIFRIIAVEETEFEPDSAGAATIHAIASMRGAFTAQDVSEAFPHLDAELTIECCDFLRECGWLMRLPYLLT